MAIENMCKKTRDLRRQVSEEKDMETNTKQKEPFFFFFLFKLIQNTDQEQ